MADLNQETSIDDDLFPKQASGLPEAHVTAAVSLADGDVLPLRIGPIRKTIAGTPLRMLAYNGSIPGPLLEGDRRGRRALRVRLRNRPGSSGQNRKS
ncbi:MAG TPA: hypothetical protein VJ820_10525 [Propionibacteriaceae bacterium]|nr:hypothetical protein [Propionibacteriaceae bacterium]